MAMSPARKRDHEGNVVEAPLSRSEFLLADADISSNTTIRHDSPTPSSTISALTELTSMDMTTPERVNMSGAAADNAGDLGTPSKRRKLTFAEKEVEKAVKKREREEKEKQRLAEKARKEEEKRSKDEERRRREEDKEVSKRTRELEKAEKKKAEDAKKKERDEKKAAKEAERQEKEAERIQKEAEKLKKEKSQMRLGAFFGRPASTSTPPMIPDDASNAASSRRNSITSIDVESSAFETPTIESSNPEYEKYIIPYFVHEHTEIAPINRFKIARQSVMFDGKASTYEIEIGQTPFTTLINRFPKRSSRLRKPTTVRKIVETLQAADVPTHLSEAVNPLHAVPLKLLSFREDVRPPYLGTYTGALSPRATRKMSRNPTYRGRTDTNYDYDSEVEWEPPAEDDDDINLDDELSDEDEDEEDMQDFLDDENDSGRKRMLMGEMEPISSGLCWQGEQFVSNGHNMDDYRMDVLHDSTTFPIDPFSTQHWADETRAKPEHKTNPEPGESTMLPPPQPTTQARPPLAQVKPPNFFPGLLSNSFGESSEQRKTSLPESKPRGRPADPNKALKLIQPEFMTAFKQAIDGSDLTKAGLVEILKKQFPKCSKDAIKDTLGVVAVRVGKKETEKTWQLV